MEDYLTMEFLNDLEIFDYEKSRTEKAVKIEVYCVEIDPLDKNKCFDCAICMDTHLEINSIVLNCKHQFCYSCISTYLKHNKTQDPKCALCREVYKSMEIPDMTNLLYIANIVNSER